MKISQNKKQTAFQYITTDLHANLVSFESDPPALTCFHKKSKHQLRYVTRGANE